MLAGNVLCPTTRNGREPIFQLRLEWECRWQNKVQSKAVKSSGSFYSTPSILLIKFTMIAQVVFYIIAASE